jgi:HEAT repeat protein
VNGALAVAIIGLGGGFLLLLGFIVVRRFRADRRKRWEERMRPQIEVGIAEYLADPDAELPEPPASHRGRILFRDIAVETLLELRGRERDRLTHLVEETGTVEDTCLELEERRPITRRHAAEFLAEMRSRDGAEALLLSLLDGDPDVRLAAALGLAELGEPSLLEPVITAVDELVVERPGAAAAVLLMIGIHTPDSLGETLDEARSPMLRRLSAAVVAERRLPQYAPQLRAALNNEDDELVARAARGLGAIGDTEAVDELVEVLVDEDRAWFCRIVAANALGALGDTRAVPPLESQLAEGEWLMRDRAAASLGQLGEPGREALDRAMKSPRSEIRVHAAVALEA